MSPSNPIQPNSAAPPHSRWASLGSAVLLSSSIALVGATAIARAGRAAVVFGVALASKQHVLLLVPLLLLCRFRPRELALTAGTAATLTLPWLLANPPGSWAAP